MKTLFNTFVYYCQKAWPFLLLVFTPVYSAMAVILILVLVDLVLGTTAAYKEGYKITSRSMRRTVSKLLVYEITVLVIFLIETYLFDFPVTKAVTALIGVIEGKSIFENLYRITKVDFLKVVITKLQMINDQLKPANDKDKEDVHTGKVKSDENN